MTHLDDATLALLATADDVDGSDAAHLDGCGICSDALAAWRTVGCAVRARASTTPLPAPSLLEGVWARLDEHAPVDDQAAAAFSPATVASTSEQGPSWSPSSARGDRRAHGLRITAVLALLRAQLPLVRRELWAASAVVLGVGVLVASALGSATAAATTLALLAPLVAGVGLAFVYGPENDPFLELATATPTPARAVLMARFTLVVGYDLVLALLANVTVVVLWPEVGLLPLVALWLGPMLVLGSLALVVGVRFGPVAGVAVAGGLWTLRVASALDGSAGGRVADLLEQLWATSVTTLALAAVLLCVAMATVSRTERVA